MPKEYLTDGDAGFIGLNSRENPANLKQGIVSLSENFRLNRGIAQVRSGCKRLFHRELEPYELKHTTLFRNNKGEDVHVFICKNRIFTYNSNTDVLTIDAPIYFPPGVVMTDTDECDAFQALDKLYITLGYGKRPLIWDGYENIVKAPVGFPAAKQGMYHSNRAIVQISRDEVSVSRYLDLSQFNQLDVFKINDGSNDEIVAITPWVLNELVIFMRNKIYYASVGSGAYASGDSIVPDDCYIKVLATDIGCVAKKSIVQAAGGIFFLSDFGVFVLTPQNSTTPEGMRVGVMGEPLSADIEDVILRINQDYVGNATAAYYNNRYYLSVPLNSVKKKIIMLPNGEVFVSNGDYTGSGDFGFGQSYGTIVPCGTDETIIEEDTELDWDEGDSGYFINEELITGDELVWQETGYVEYVDETEGCTWKWTPWGFELVPKSLGIPSISNHAYPGQAYPLKWAPVPEGMTSPPYTQPPYNCDQVDPPDPHDPHWTPTPIYGNPAPGTWAWVPESTPDWNQQLGYEYNGSINVIVPYDIGKEYQEGDFISVTGIDYYNINGSLETINGSFEVIKVTRMCNKNNFIIISINIPYYDYVNNEVSNNNQITIQKISKFNNCVLVYNFIQKKWESVDNYNSNVDFQTLMTGIRKGTRRLFVSDSTKGLFLLEETLRGDEFGPIVSEPLLDNVYVPFLLEDVIYGKRAARGKIVTRSYNFGNIDDKRYSSAEIDIYSPEGGKSRTSVITENPDTTTVVDIYETDKDSQSSRDVPIRKFGSNAKIMIETYGCMPIVRSTYITAVDPGNNTRSSE